MTTALILISAFLTSALSSVFGMAGGLILMGVLALALPVEQAFVAHGAIQIVANGGRAILQRAHIEWKVMGYYVAGALVAALSVALVAFVPSKPFLFLALGLVPVVLWLPKNLVRLDAARPPDATAAGLLVTGVNLLAGVAGPLLDIFFVKTAMTRHQIVATKAATQVFAHLAKILVYGIPAVTTSGIPDWLLWALLGAAPLSVLGTNLGAKILDRMSDKRFLEWTRIIVTAIGAVYLVQAIILFMTP